MYTNKYRGVGDIWAYCEPAQRSKDYFLGGRGHLSMKNNGSFHSGKSFAEGHPDNCFSLLYKTHTPSEEICLIVETKALVQVYGSRSQGVYNSFPNVQSTLSLPK